MKKKPRSWRTTALGILLIAGAGLRAAAALVDGNPATQPNWAEIYGAVVGGLGLIKAKDDKEGDKP